MNANLLSSALKKVKSNPESSQYPLLRSQETSKDTSSRKSIAERISSSLEAGEGDLYSVFERLKRPKQKEQVELPHKMKEGSGRQQRLRSAQPYAPLSSSSTNTSNTSNIHKLKQTFGNRLVIPNNKTATSSLTPFPNPSNRERYSDKTDLEWKHDLCEEVALTRYMVFVRGLASNVNYERVKQIFAKFGEVSGIKKDRETAEVYFYKRDAAMRAAKETNLTKIGQNIIKVMFTEPTSADSRLMPMRDRKSHKMEEEQETKMESDIMEEQSIPSIFSRIRKP